MIPVAWWGSGWGTWIRNQFRQHPNFSMAARETTVRNCSTLLEPVKLPRRHRSTRRRVRVNDHGIWSTLRRNSGFQPASFRRVLTPPLDLWLRTRSRAKRRRTAMFLAPWPCRYRERSSLKVTSRSQCMRRVAPGNRTPRLSQNRTGHSRVIRLPSSKPSYGLKGFAVFTSFLLSPVELETRRLDPPPLLRPHYQPSSLLQGGPSQCPASVLSPRGCCRLCFSLGIGTTGSRSSAQEPGSESRPLYAGRRLPSHQAPGRLVPGDRNAPGFDDKSLDYDASSKVHFRSSLLIHTCLRYVLNALTPMLTTTALYRSSLGWFEARSWKPTPKGLPSSLMQL